MKPYFFLIIAASGLGLAGCEPPAPTGKALSVDQTQQKAKSDLNTRLEKSQESPEVRQRANAELERAMQSTAAQRALSNPSNR